MSLETQRNATAKRRAPTTTKMVDEALIEKNSRKGVTLQGIYAFIAEKYSLDVTKSRQNLIKKHILALRDSQDLVNVTGKGFSGHIKLVDKTNFVRKLNRVKRQAKKKKTNNRSAQTRLDPPVLPTQDYELDQPILPSQVYELEPPVLPSVVQPVQPRALLRPTYEHLDTPMVPDRASTPIHDDYLPKAPRRSKTTHQSDQSERPNVAGTPRSSLPGAKRRARRI